MNHFQYENVIDSSIAHSKSTLFQEARKIVGALIQQITYKEWLPIILDRSQLVRHGLELQSFGQTRSYNPQVDPTIRNVFASAAFRFGHSLIRTSLSQV